MKRALRWNRSFYIVLKAFDLKLWMLFLVFGMLERPIRCNAQQACAMTPLFCTMNSPATSLNIYGLVFVRMFSNNLVLLLLLLLLGT